MCLFALFPESNLPGGALMASSSAQSPEGLRNAACFTDCLQLAPASRQTSEEDAIASPGHRRQPIHPELYFPGFN